VNINMEIMILDIWLSKIRSYGWKIEDTPNRKIKKELRKILKKERRNLKK